MKLFKTFALAALAAAIAMALAGVAPAMAEETAICKSSEAGVLECAEENQLKKIHAVATDQVFLSGSFAVLCSTSLMQLELEELAAPQVATITELTWADCLAGGSCTVTALVLGTFLLLKTEANLGVGTFDETKIELKCFLFNCTYNPTTLHLLGNATLLAGAGGANGGFTGAKARLEPSGGDAPCPEIAWDVFYESLTPVYIKT